MKKSIRTLAVRSGRLFFGRAEEAALVSEIRRVLAFKVWAIGEVIMATPALRALRELLPEAHITILTGWAAYPVVELSPRADEVRAVEEALFLGPKLLKLTRLVKELRAERYDLVVSLHHAWQFGVFAALVGARHAVGFDREGEGFAYTVRVSPGQGRHQVEEYFDLAAALGAPGGPGPLEVYADESDEEFADKTEASVRESGKRLVVFAPGGGANPKTRMPSKRWPAARWAELAGMFARDYSVVLAGGPGDEAAAAAVMKRVRGPRPFNLVGRTTIRQLYALLRRADLFVGNDSAPAHVAAAAGIPTVALFGPTDPTLNSPWSPRALVIKGEADCAPCYRDGYFPECPRVNCLTDITAEKVHTAAMDFLDTLRVK